VCFAIKNKMSVLVLMPSKLLTGFAVSHDARHLTVHSRILAKFSYGYLDCSASGMTENQHDYITGPSLYTVCLKDETT
jgi:hypothetical protein